MNGFKLPTKNRVDPAQLASFAAQAVRKEPEPIIEPKKEEAKQVFDDKRRIPAFPIRLTELELALLREKSQTTPDSMHSYCIKALRKELGIT